MPSDQNDSADIDNKKDPQNGDEGNRQPPNKLWDKAQIEIAEQIPNQKSTINRKRDNQKAKEKDRAKDVAKKRKINRSNQNI